MMNLLGIAAVVVIGVFGWNMTALAGYETAEYKVVETDGRFEIREYPDLMLASTSTRIDAQGRDGSFMKLFRYISGANQSEQQISMTTPVFMEKDDTEAQMGFVMPQEVAVAGTPQPTGEGVTIRKRAGGRFAVIRFPGRLNEKLANENETKLREWMKTKNLTAAETTLPNTSPAAPESAHAEPTNAESANVESASYDPPFTPGPLRRNEVLIRLQ